MGRYPNNNIKPIVGENVVTPNVCVVTRAQKAAIEQEKKNDDKDDSVGDSTSDSSENDMDSKNKDEDSSDVGSDEELPSEGGMKKQGKMIDN